MTLPGDFSGGIDLVIRGANTGHLDLSRINKSVLKRYFYAMTVRYSASTFKFNLDTQRSNNSYFSLDRINRVFESKGVAPILRWNSNTEKLTSCVRKQLPPVVLAVHLKNVSPGNHEESNANGSVWAESLERFLSGNNKTVILIGEDPLPKEIKLGPNLIRGSDLGLDLGSQLAIVPKCAGFIGMASGVASAAIFSRNPYTIFKHPKHDAREMQLELGDKDQFAFAASNQKVLREEPTISSIGTALNMIVTGK
jgi:hypothetical protein